MLQTRFAIVRCPAHFSNRDTLAKIMTCCVVLHDMVNADERGIQMAKEYDMLAYLSSLIDTQTTFKHVSRRDGRMKTGPPMINCVKISLSINDSCMGDSVFTCL